MAFRCTLLVVANIVLAASIQVQYAPSPDTPTCPSPDDEEGNAAACPCLNWKQAYAEGRAVCGNGFEFSRIVWDNYPMSAEQYLRLTNTTVMPYREMLKNEFCDSFFSQMDDSRCVRTAMDRHPTAWWGKSWCYVSPSCKCSKDTSLGSPDHAHVKICNEEHDQLLSAMPPDELMAYGKRMGMWVPGFMVKMSYPLERKMFWKDRSEHQQELQDIRDSGIPTVIDAVDEHQDKMIVMGNRTWVLPNSYDGYKLVD